MQCSCDVLLVDDALVYEVLHYFEDVESIAAPGIVYWDVVCITSKNLYVSNGTVKSKSTRSLKGERMGKPLFSFLLVTDAHLQLLMSRHLTLLVFRSAVRLRHWTCCGLGVLSSRCLIRGLGCDSIVGAGPLPRASCSASV